MISETQKAQIVAKMKQGFDLQELADEHDISVKLLKEWESKFDHRDLVALNANINAVEAIVHGELMPNREDELREVLELTAIDIAKEASVALDDPMHAKAVELCATSVDKLYKTIILKIGATVANETNPGEHLSTFQQLMRD